MTDTCPNCGGWMRGDGFTIVQHCENYEGNIFDIEPDTEPLFCEEQNDNTD